MKFNICLFEPKETPTDECYKNHPEWIEEIDTDNYVEEGVQE